ncbi:hypothetical protein Tco_0979840 [Tanacetum coccineum]
MGNFRYHTGYEELKITNLCFADDLLILCNGNSTSREELKEEILEIIPFAVGKLPVRYLGVPLVTRRLRVKDCKSLVEKVKGKTYWALVFFLPKTNIKEIDSILKSFLWSQGEKINGKAKIAWKNACKPKQCGGLGFKPIEKWNEVLIIKHLWNVASKKDSLWVKWVNIYRLKGRNVWEVANDEIPSWGWRKLMELRKQVRPYIRHCLGNGESTNTWHDFWCDIRPIDEKVTRRQIFSAGFHNDATVASMVRDGEIKMPED